ncbi:MAG: MBOAT family protein, partial [Clostridia bacterium]|nr:MBOAT family protein [Clostridia bacterium]
SVTEFWRRWHMTLGSWFRDYLYIPLGGNRVKLPKWIFNILVVWMLTGLWHGASWNFVLWGLYFGILLIVEKLFLSKLFEKIPRVFSHIYLLLAVVFGFVLFNAESLSVAAGDVGAMFGAGGLPLWTGDTGYYLSGFAVLLVISAVGATPLVKTLVLKIYSRPRGEKVMNILRPAALAAILLLCTAYFADNSFSPFLYFRF